MKLLQKPVSRMQAQLLVLLAPLLFSENRKLRSDTRGIVSLGPILSIVGLVLGVVISALVLAALAPNFFSAIADLTGAMATADLNNSLANTILGIIVILVPLVMLFGFVALIFRVGRNLK